MKISQTHQRFSYRLKEPRALTNPEDFLGPNWEDVINFWIYIDTLSEDEKIRMENRYYALKLDVRVSAFHPAYDAAEEIVGGNVRSAVWYASFDVTSRCVFAYVTYELISHHKLLEQNKTLVALPLCFTSCDH